MNVETMWKVLLPGVLLGVLSGCAGGMQGTWNLQEISPATAATKFQLTEIEFKPDGKRYEADAMVGGRAVELVGHYTYDADAGTITFESEEMPARVYNVEINKDTGEMAIRPTKPGRHNWKATYTKERRL